jgi:hypothetical protein
MQRQQSDGDDAAAEAAARAAAARPSAVYTQAGLYSASRTPRTSQVTNTHAPRRSIFSNTERAEAALMLLRVNTTPPQPTPFQTELKNNSYLLAILTSPSLQCLRFATQER